MTLVERASRGEEVIIGKAGVPVAKLVGVDLDERPRDLEQAPWKGRVWMADDFDDLPDEVLAAFGAGGNDEPSP